MRKRRRKRRGILGKMIGGILAFLVLILLAAGMFWTIEGYLSYQKAIKEKPLAQTVEKIRSEASWVSLDEVPELYKKAVLAVEDHRYYRHHGVDWISTARAVMHDIRVMKMEQGGSTITQQLVKNMYYDQNKTIARKAAEAWTALYVEQCLSKEEILELYINTIYFGDGYYGLKAASIGYFGKTPQELGGSEAVLLAGIPNAPSAYAPSRHADLALQREKQVLAAMVKYGYLEESKKDGLLWDARENPVKGRAE